MQFPEISGTWAKIIDTIVNKLPVAILSAVVGVVVALLGATGGGIFGIPVDSIEGGWRLAFGFAGLVLFLASVWKFLQIADLAPTDDTDVKREQPSLEYSLVMTTPRGHRATVSVSKPVGTAATAYLEFAGSVQPGDPDTGVWLLRQKHVRDPEGGVSREVNTVFAYEVEVDEDAGSWNGRMSFPIWASDERVEFWVWAVIPNRDALLLLRHHWENREAFDDAEKAFKDAKEGLEDRGVKVDWKRPWIPLPDIPGCLARAPQDESKYFTVIVRRETA
jgi:hypothetical protein